MPLRLSRKKKRRLVAQSSRWGFVLRKLRWSKDEWVMWWIRNQEQDQTIAEWIQGMVDEDERSGVDKTP